MRDLGEKFAIKVGKNTYYKGRKHGCKLLMRTVIDYYNMMPSYAVELTRVNKDNYSNLHIIRWDFQEDIY